MSFYNFFKSLFQKFKTQSKTHKKQKTQRKSNYSIRGRAITPLPIPILDGPLPSSPRTTPSRRFREHVTPFLDNPPNTVQFLVPRIKDCVFSVTKIVLSIQPSDDIMNPYYTFGFRRGRWSLLGGSETWKKTRTSGTRTSRTRTSRTRTRLHPKQITVNDKRLKSIAKRPVLHVGDVLRLIEETWHKYHGKIRMEISLSFKERLPRCDVVNWHPDTDDMLIRLTRQDQSISKRLSSKNRSLTNSVIVFDPHLPLSSSKNIRTFTTPFSKESKNTRSSYPTNVFEFSSVDLKYIYDFHSGKQVSIWTENL